MLSSLGHPANWRTDVAAIMGRPFVEFVQDDSAPRYCCQICNADVASSNSLVWEGFMGTQQPAYLFNETINIEAYSSRREERLSTGTYILIDVRCRSCLTHLGWQYLKANNQDQKYKEGGILLQQQMLCLKEPTISACPALEST